MFPSVKKIILFSFMCRYVYVPKYTYAVAHRSQKLALGGGWVGIRTPRAGVTGSCESPVVSAEL